MKTTSTLSALLTLILLLGPSALLAQTEIAIEDDEPAQAEKAAPAPPKQAAPAQEEEESIEVEGEEVEGKSEEKEAPAEETTKEEATTEEESGSGAMRPVYEAGIKAYRQKSYWKAVALLSKASEIKDPETPKYYYAEAHAMMGVIFHFYLKKSDKACRHYQLALKIDPKTRTALKYRHKVCR